MITIFTIPKAFSGEISQIQKNAIRSWTLLDSGVEVILFGDEEGTSQAATEFQNVRRYPQVKKSEFGTPLLDDVFQIAQKIAKNDILAYVNADIILLDDFLPAVKKINFPKFLLTGRRTDLNLREAINFSQAIWQKLLREKVDKEGKGHGWSGLDYFVFPRHLYRAVPPFAIGRFSFDNWLIYYVRDGGWPVIDATEALLAVHQNHAYSQKKKSFFITEKQKNLKLAGGVLNLMSIRDADWILDKKDGTLRRPRLPRRIFPFLSSFYPWRLILGLKRILQWHLTN